MSHGYRQFLGERQASNLMYRFLRNLSNPDKATNLEMNVVGSLSNPVNFDMIAPDEERHVIQRVNPVMLDTGYSPDKFGGLTALTNGLRIVVMDEIGNEAFDFYDGVTLKQNADWIPLSGVDSVQERTAAISVIAGRWTIRKGGANLWLPPRHCFRIIVQDDLSDIDFFRVMVQGQIFRDHNGND